MGSLEDFLSGGAVERLGSTLGYCGCDRVCFISPPPPPPSFLPNNTQKLITKNNGVPARALFEGFLPWMVSTRGLKGVWEIRNI